MHSVRKLEAFFGESWQIDFLAQFDYAEIKKKFYQAEILAEDSQNLLSK